MKNFTKQNFKTNPLWIRLLIMAFMLLIGAGTAWGATQRYIYVGLSNNYHQWKNTTTWGINQWGGTSAGVISGSKIEDLGTTITHSGCTFHMYRMYRSCYIMTNLFCQQHILINYHHYMRIVFEVLLLPIQPFQT